MQRMGIADAIFKKIEHKERKSVPPFKNFIKGFTTFFALIVAVLITVSTVPVKRR